MSKHQKFSHFTSAIVLGLGVLVNVNAAELSVTIDNVASAKGNVLVSVCDKQSFLKKCAINRMVPASAKGVVTVEVKDLPPGEYALMTFHDENSNLKFDRDSNGMPQEGWGFSKNARGKFGAPSFEEAALTIKDGANKTSISLSY